MLHEQYYIWPTLNYRVCRQIRDSTTASQTGHWKWKSSTRHCLRRATKWLISGQLSQISTSMSIYMYMYNRYIFLLSIYGNAQINTDLAELLALGMRVNHTHTPSWFSLDWENLAGMSGCFPFAFLFGCLGAVSRRQILWKSFYLCHWCHQDQVR